MNLMDFLRTLGIAGPQGPSILSAQPSPADVAALSGAAPGAGPPALAAAPPDLQSTGLTAPPPAAPPAQGFQPPPPASQPVVTPRNGASAPAPAHAPVVDPLAGKGYGFIPNMGPAQWLMYAGAGLKDLGDIGLGESHDYAGSLLNNMRQWNLSMLQRQQRAQVLQNGAFASDPVAAQAYLWDPTQINENVAKRYGPQETREGGMVSYGPPGTGGPPPAVNPKVTMYGDQPIALSPTGSYPLGPPLPMSAEDQQRQAQANAAPIDAAARMTEAQARAYEAHRPDVRYLGVDQSGHPILQNAYSNDPPYVDSSIVVGAKPSSAGGVLDKKVGYYENDLGYSHQDAVRAALGTARSPQQQDEDAQRIANSRAIAEDVTDPAAIKAIHDEVLADLKADVASVPPASPYEPPATGPRPAAGGAPPSPAVAALHPGTQQSFSNGQTWARSADGKTYWQVK